MNMVRVGKFEEVGDWVHLFDNGWPMYLGLNLIPSLVAEKLNGGLIKATLLCFQVEVVFPQVLKDLSNMALMFFWVGIRIPSM